MTATLYFPQFNRLVTDSFRNLVSMLGSWKDKSVYAEPYLDLLNLQQLEMLYRGDWVCRKIIDLPAWDMCRAWRSWQAEPEQIESLEEAERQFGLQRKLISAISRARLYGGSAILMGLEGTGDFNSELDVNDVKKGALKFVHVISGGRNPMLMAGSRDLDVTSEWFGEPSYYQRTNIATMPPPGGVEQDPPSSLAPPGSTLYIHPSRVIRLVGLEYPDPENSMDPWGDSCLQPVYDAVKAAASVNSSVAAMLQEAKVDIIKMKGLSELLSTTAGAEKLYNRFMNSNVAKSSVNTLMLDVEEEFETRQLQFGNLDKVLTLYLLMCCAAADIPATRLLGREPAGLNATGDGDIRNYYDRLSADQKVRLQPVISRLDEVLIRHTLGSRDDDIHYDWNPLWQMSDEEKSNIELRKAQTHLIDVNSGLIDPMVLKVSRENSLIESGFLYPGLEAAIDKFDGMDEEQFVPVPPQLPGQPGPNGKLPGKKFGQPDDKDQTPMESS